MLYAPKVKVFFKSSFFDETKMPHSNRAKILPFNWIQRWIYVLGSFVSKNEVNKNEVNKKMGP